MSTTENIEQIELKLLNKYKEEEYTRRVITNNNSSDIFALFYFTNNDLIKDVYQLMKKYDIKNNTV